MPIQKMQEILQSFTRVLDFLNNKGHNFIIQSIEENYSTLIIAIRKETEEPYKLEVWLRDKTGELCVENAVSMQDFFNIADEFDMTEEDIHFIKFGTNEDNKELHNTEPKEQELEKRVDTTFWQDFTTADMFGIKGIKETFKLAFEGWKYNYKYFTELVMVLNHKCWDWYEKNDEYSELYSDLYYKARDYALDNFKGKELDFYYKVTN